MVGRDEAGRRAAINTIGPLWDGNEVWLIVAGAGMFAAFPGWYATMFSGLQPRPGAAAGRADRPRPGVRVPRQTRRRPLAPHLGRPADRRQRAGPAADRGGPGRAARRPAHQLRQDFTGSFWDLLQPYPLWTGITLVLLCALHGATFLCLKTTGDMRERSWQLARRLAPVTGAFVIGFIIWTHVTASSAFWLNLIELTAILAVLAAVWLVWDHHEGFAFAATAVTIASCIISIFADLYPNVMVSSTNPAYNLTVHNTASGGVLAQGR